MRFEAQGVLYMKSMRTPVGAIVVAALLCIGLQGCPPDVGLQLLVSSDTLDFGMDKEEMRLRVYKNYTSAVMAPLVVSTNQEWILPQNCNEASDNCVSRGPRNAIRIPVQIDRNKLALGVNEGKIRLNSGTAAEVVVKVLADEILQADFQAKERSIGLGRPVELLDMGLAAERAGEVNRWLWEFGDGAVSTRQNPSHLYSAPGVYDITLTVTTDKDVSRTVVKPAYILVKTPDNLVDFIASSTNVDVNEEILFTDTSVIQDAAVLARSWDFGDGNESTALAPKHRYAEPGVYTVSLTITTSAGDMRAVKENYIVVRSAGALRANFTYNTSGGSAPYVGETIQFSDISEVGRGEITEWRWDFGDGVLSDEQNPQHQYDDIGTYTVKLTIVSDYGADSTEKSITVVFRPPLAKFIAEPTEQWAGSPVQFVDQSVAGYGEIISWEWDFGNNETSTDQNPLYVYANPGVYTVSLTVTSDDSEATRATLSKKDYITINAVPNPPNPAFSYQPRLALTEERVSFEAADSTITDEPILEYLWDFGDGEEARGRTASHRYADPGRYDVVLTVITESTRANEPPGVSVMCTVAVDRPPTSEFFIWRRDGDDIVSAVDGYTYVDMFSFSIAEQPVDARQIRQYIWDFGDDAGSDMPAPTHTYDSEGQYSVNLTVTFRHSASRPSDEDLRKTSAKQLRIKPSIYDYVHEDDDCFYYSNPNQQSIMLGGQQVATAFLIYNFTSQCWNPDNAVAWETQRWTHPVVIYEPRYKMRDTAMLFIDGGSRTSTPRVEEAMWQIAVVTGTTVVHLRNVPSQPIVFTDEIIRAGQEDNNSGQNFVLRYRTEDAAIAYTYDRYMDSYAATGGNPNYRWPLLFPMVKSAVKAMDMTEEVLALEGVELDGFVVAGGSKRGWTTWLTGAVDSRVKAIAPIVINVLNMKPHLEHHRQVYGYWAPAIYDYAQERVFDRLVGDNLAPGARVLLEYVDPYEYSRRGRYSMPKFLLNATGDEFFVPDTAELYFHDLEPDAHMSYVPNVGHGMGGVSSGPDLTQPRNPTGMLLAWYMAVTQEADLPEFAYTFEENGAIRVSVDPNDTIVEARVYKATAQGSRDFRNPNLGPAWTYQSLFAQAGGETGAYYVTPPIAEPEPGSYTAYFIQLEYANSAVFPDSVRTLLEAAGYSVPNMVFTTGVRVMPEEYPEFTGYLANSERPDAVLFDEDKLPVIVVYGNPEEMGNYYGQLLAPYINAFVRDYTSYYLELTGATVSQLRSAWTEISPFLDARMLQEMQGIVEAPGVNITLEQLQVAHAAALFEVLGTNTSVGTTAYRELMEGNGGALAASLNSRFHRYQCAVLYIPDDGVPHTVLTHAGLTFGRIGVNLGGISSLEIVDVPVWNEEAGEWIDPYTGEPFAFTGLEPNALPLTRTILYDSLNLRDAVALVKAAPLQRPTTMLLSDGRAELRSARLRMYPGNEVLEERYDLALSDFEIADKRGVVFGALSELQPPLQTAIEELLPSRITFEEMVGLVNTTPFAQPGANPMNVVIDGTMLNIFVSVAKEMGGIYFEAYKDTPEAFNMQLLLP